MAADLGREFTIQKDAALLMTGIQNKTVSSAINSVEVTSDDDNGYQTFLTRSGKIGMDISFDGVSKDSVIQEQVYAGDDISLTGVTVTFIDGATLAGDFIISAFSQTGNHEDAVTFSAQLQSNGAYVYTPPAP